MSLMRNMFLTASLAAMMLAAPARADGVYAMYTAYDEPLGEIIVVGDVYAPNGQPFVLLEMPDMEMWFYFPPDGIYVTMDQNNPVIYNQIPFYGEWVSTRYYDEPCPGGPNLDHLGQPRPTHGEAVITNTAIDDYHLIFEIAINTCNGPLEFFAYHNPYNPGYGNGSFQGGGTNVITK